MKERRPANKNRDTPTTKKKEEGAPPRESEEGPAISTCAVARLEGACLTSISRCPAAASGGSFPPRPEETFTVQVGWELAGNGSGTPGPDRLANPSYGQTARRPDGQTARWPNCSDRQIVRSSDGIAHFPGRVGLTGDAFLPHGRWRRDMHRKAGEWGVASQAHRLLPVGPCPSVQSASARAGSSRFPFPPP